MLHTSAAKPYADSSCVLIYQMGKVGSTALANAFPGAIHLHSLYGHSPNPMLWRAINRGPLKALRRQGFECLKRKLIRKRKIVKVVSLVRDPMARDISSFFQDLPHWLAKHLNQSSISVREENFSLLEEAFETTFDHSYCLNWFDKEFYRFTKVDIYEHPFDRTSGFSIINSGKFSIFLGDIGRLNLWKEELNTFLGHDLSLKEKNRGQKKWYAPLYKEFLSSYRPSGELIAKLYDSRLANHFFSDSNRLIMEKRWLIDLPESYREPKTLS